MNRPVMLEDQIRRNRRNSLLLLLLVPALLATILYVLGTLLTGLDPFLLLTAAIGISIIYVAISSTRGDAMILAVTDAHEADPEKHRQLYDLVEGLSIATGSPTPRLYVQDSPDINAYATGKNPDDGKICVTTGALDSLNRLELEGVLAHELAHVRNQDVRFTTLVVALVGIISIVSELFLRSLWFRPGRGNNRNPAILIAGIALAIIAPIAARLVQLAFSRQREYLADADGAMTTRYPDGLADALEKIREGNEGMKVNRAVAPLYLADPFKKRVRGLLSTHPPIEDRIERLREM